MTASAPVLWRHRVLVGTDGLPILVEPPAGGGGFHELDPARDGDAQLVSLGDAATPGTFVDPRFELGRLPPALRASLLRAIAIARWSDETRFCALCGAGLRWETPGLVKICENPTESHRHFPRIDPATIMLVHDGERMLLGRQPEWPPGMYSTLAGFVDAGESAEAAVAREVFEEAGVRISGITYFGSESWPFPRSLMLGFFARADSTEIVRGDELEDVRWFSPDEGRELQRTLARRMPGADTIARRMIARWLDERAAASSPSG
jgi:NAD+ diphosphatase